VARPFHSLASAILFISLSIEILPNCTASCAAQDSCCCATCAENAGHGDEGCLWCRTNLTGDWHGRRSGLAANGITFQGDVTQYYQGVTSGGLQRHFKYGGHSDYVVNMDLGKLGAWQGLFLKLRGESQFGEFVNRDVGSLLAANAQGLNPTPGEQKTALTNVLVTQMLSEKTAVFFGKLDTLDGDANAFAHGRGKNQFMNVAMVVNPIAFRTHIPQVLGR